MPTQTDDNIKSQMRKGILEYCILLLLSRERSYPSDIIAKLAETNFIVVEGTVYTLLNRMRKEGKLTYEWEESRLGPPRKYYLLTDAGHAALEALRKEWEQISATVNHFEKQQNSEENETL